MMEPSRDFIGYVVTGVVAAFILKRLLTTLSAKRKIPALLKEGAQIVDVRSPGEFATGHAAGSRNIPLGDLERGAKDLDSKRWVIVCCASGTRSGTARRWLSTRPPIRARFQHDDIRGAPPLARAQALQDRRRRRSNHAFCISPAARSCGTEARRRRWRAQCGCPLAGAAMCRHAAQCRQSTNRPLQ